MKTTSIFAFGLALVGTALTLTVAAGPAMASPVAPRSVSVVVNPSDLATVSGRNALDARIARAARQVCDFNRHERGLGASTRQQACVRQAVTSTQDQIAQMKSGVIHMASAAR